MPIEFRTRSKSNQPNPNDVGACCVYNEGSSSYTCNPDTSYISCKRDLGIFRGKGSDCNGEFSCPTSGTSGLDRLSSLESDQHGACKTCSTCTDNVLEENCINKENFDADFFGGQVCSQIDSSILTQSYGCCVDDGCFDTCNPSYCSELGGLLHDGINTSIAMKCASNPCNSNDLNERINTGASCKQGRCIGTLTEYDSERNGGSWKGIGSDCSNYDCANNKFISDSNVIIPPISSPLNQANIVCSIPTPKIYYNNGIWSGVTGPIYGRESVIVRNYTTSEECIQAGGIVSATDGDLNKVTMWGGCQYWDGTSPSQWKCESKTYNQCVELSGKWTSGVYCDDIRSQPASGLFFSNELLSGVNTNEKFLAGSCHVIDNVISPIGGNLNNSTKCADMMTQYQCVKALVVLKSYYEKVIEAGDNVGWDEDRLLAPHLETKWTPGRRCSDCTDNQVPLTDDVIGLCQLTKTQTGSIGIQEYTYNTANQNVCLDGYNRTDCEALHGTWIDTCDTCIDQGYVTSVATGSCCTSASNCINGQTKQECDTAGGFFHGPDTSCVDRNCSMVAYLTTDNISELSPAECKCEVSDDPDATDTAIVKIYVREDAQNGDNIWAGSQCGDPTVDAIPHWSEAENFRENELVSYSLPPNTGQKFSGTKDIGIRYNFEGQGFRNFITTGIDGSSGSFLDDIIIQDKQNCFFRIDKKTPVLIPNTKNTLERLQGFTLETNQPADSIYRLVLNDPNVELFGGSMDRIRKITWVDLAGMINLREFGIQGNNWPTLQNDFETAATTTDVFGYLRILNMRGSNLSSLDISNLPALEKLDLSTNNITSLDLTSNTYITDLRLDYNNLSSLTFGDDPKIYLSRLNVSYNLGLSEISGTYPQLEEFVAVQSGIKTPMFENMPYLQYIDLTSTALESITINHTPYITYIGLDSCIGTGTILSNCTLPNRSNRTIATVPNSISEAVIPDSKTALSDFNCRRNFIRADGYNDFTKKLADTASITQFTKFCNTEFSSIGDLGDAPNIQIECLEIDFSNVIDVVDDETTPTNSSVFQILNYMLSGESTSINHEEKIRIILTGINTSVQWSDTLLNKLRSNVNVNFASRLVFIM